MERQLLASGDQCNYYCVIIRVQMWLFRSMTPTVLFYLFIFRCGIAKRLKNATSVHLNIEVPFLIQPHHSLTKYTLQLCEQWC